MGRRIRRLSFFWICVSLLVSLTAPASADAVFSFAGTVSPRGESASAPQVAVTSRGNAVVTWTRFDGTSAACCYRVQARARSRATGTWDVVQNVSPSGQNASAPQFDVDADGDAVVVWIARDATTACGGSGCRRVMARARSAAGTLGPVQVLSHSGAHAESPRIALDPDGNAMVVWKSRDGASDCCPQIKARARSAGGTLSRVQTLSSAAAAAPVLSVDSDGNAVFAWSDDSRPGISPPRVLTRARLATGDLGPVEVLSPSGRDPQIAMTADGRAVFAWTALGPTGSTGVEVRARAPDGALSEPRSISAAGSDPRLGVDGDGDAVFAWREVVGGKPLLLARTRSASGALSAVQAVSDPGYPAEGHKVAVDANGNAAFVWLRDDGTSADSGTCCRRLYARSRSAAGTLSAIQTLSGAGRNASSAEVSVDPNGGPDSGVADAFAVWARRRAGSLNCCSRVRTAKQFACEAFASPSSGATGSGSRSATFASAQQLADSLAPGETGCLRSGTYREDLTLTKGGRPGLPLTLRSYPGERAKLLGRLFITDSANFVTVSSLDLDGRTAPACQTGSSCSILPSPTVYGNHVTFSANDVTNGHTAICFVLGSETGGRAVGTRIERNRIHNCGRLPATNHDHGIYVEAADNVRIEDNVIYDNADRGIQLYPDAQRTYIVRNVLDGNGEGILFAERSSGNLAEQNIITNSKIRWNLESFNLTGVGNEARFNCLYATNANSQFNQNGGVDPAIGIYTHDNVVSDPLYMDPTTRDFRLREGSPCAGKGPR